MTWRHTKRTLCRLYTSYLAVASFCSYCAFACVPLRGLCLSVCLPESLRARLCPSVCLSICLSRSWLARFFASIFPVWTCSGKSGFYLKGSLKVNARHCPTPSLTKCNPLNPMANTNRFSNCLQTFFPLFALFPLFLLTLWTIIHWIAVGQQSSNVSD